MVALGALAVAACGSSATTGTTSTTAPAAITPASPLAALLGRPATSAETATYLVRPTYSTTPVSAVVSRDATRVVVSIRNIEYRTSGGTSETCNRTTKTCAAGLDAQPVSDLLITSQFWGPAPSAALRSPTLVNRIGPMATSVTTVSGQHASCVSIPGPDLTEQYCALDSGLLASEHTGRVEIVLSSYHAGFDQTLWSEFPGA